MLKIGLETKLLLTPVFWKAWLYLPPVYKNFEALAQVSNILSFSVYWCRARALFQKVKLQNIFSNWGIASCFIILTCLGYKATLLDLTGLMGCYKDADECVGQISCDCDKMEGVSYWNVLSVLLGIGYLSCKACCFCMLSVFFFLIRSHIASIWDGGKLVLGRHFNTQFYNFILPSLVLIFLWH